MIILEKNNQYHLADQTNEIKKIAEDNIKE